MTTNNDKARAKRDPRSSPRFVDLTGRRFGRLVVEAMGDVRESDARHRLWRCVCDCGARVNVAGVHLRHDHTKSCGCLQRDTVGAARRAHGKSGTPEFATWARMIARCRPGGRDAHLYYDKGIRVCERWRDDFAAFLADMGPRPSPRHSIDRIDGSKGYEPSNCRWALPVVQANNTSRNVRITIGGVTLTIAQWMARYGIRKSTVYQRVRRGMSLTEALTKETKR